MRKLKRSIRLWMAFFILSLLLSGLTAFPIETELQWLLSIATESNSPLYHWLRDTYTAVSSTNKAFPTLAYACDWLAFAHIVLAIVFIGPFVDPVRNIWVIQFGCIACILVLPLAFIAGPLRHIPFFWQLIDCSFGVMG